MKKYVYPLLPAVKTTPFFRIGGNGLANCMFVVARAFLLAREYGAELIEPTWFNLCTGPYLRGQADKRHYLGLFKTCTKNSYFKKVFLLLFFRKNIEIVCGLSGYFEEILNDAVAVRNFFEKITVDKIKQRVEKLDYSNVVAVHIRLGDYDISRRVPIGWFVERIGEIAMAGRGKWRFMIFSDGNDVELKQVLELPNVFRSPFHIALEDIWAISKCSFIIGSDSTFSGWGAYLGQKTILWPRRHFGRVLVDVSKEIVLGVDFSREGKEYSRWMDIIDKL